jgi:zinc protease
VQVIHYEIIIVGGGPALHRRRLEVKALLFARLAAAQIETAPPPPEPLRPVHLPRAVQATLPNGLRIIVVEKHGVPLVAARLLIATGSEADPPRLPGLAAMTATLLSKGTATRSAEQIARDVEVLGATLDTGAGWDNSFPAVDVMSSRFPKALANLADVMLHPAFAQAEVEREGQKQIDQLRARIASLAGSVNVTWNATRSSHAGGCLRDVK